MKFLEKMRETDAVRACNRFLNSKYMLVVLAVLTLLSNVFALEFWIYALIALLGFYLCLFGKDMLLLAPIFVFMYISPSVKNHPFYNAQSIFYPENGLWVMIVLIAIFFALLLLRIGTDGGFVRFFRKKRKLLLGFLFLGVAFLSGGTGYKEYTARNLAYSLLLFAAFFLLYFILIATVDWKDVPKDYFAWMGLFIGFTVCIELVNVYIIHANMIFSDGNIVRNYLYTGWGTYTSMSIVLAMCMPCAFYLAAVRKYGFIFNILGNVLFLAVLATHCRGSMLVAAVVYALCMAETLYKKRNRIANLVVYGAVCAAAAVVLVLHWEKIAQTILGLFEMGDHNRFNLFKDGCERFLRNPFFGQGFFACPERYFNPAQATFIPSFWHNTFIQMLAACGVFGLAAYLFHRYQTLKLFFVKPTLEKNFLLFSVFTVLLSCMIDCHLFNIGVTFFYSVLLTFAEKEPEMEKDTEEDIAEALICKIRAGRKRGSEKL